MRIGVQNLIALKQFAFVFKPLDNLFVGVFYKKALVFGYLAGKLTFGIDGTNGRHTGGFKNAVIVFTETRSRVNNARSVFGGNEVAEEHAEGTLSRFLVRAVFVGRQMFKIRKKRFVPQAFKLGSFFCPQYFRLRFAVFFF